MEYWPGIHSLDASRVSNVYLVMGPPLTLIDTGPPGTLARLLTAIKRAGAEPAELRRVILTHGDIDHIGNARALRRLTGAEVCAHDADAPYISGARQWPGLRRAISAVMGRGEAPPTIDRLLREGDVLDGLTVLHLPGHTPGHIGLQRGAVLFSGDTIAGGRTPRPAPRLLNWNQALLYQSIARMATLDFDLLLPGHGTPVNDGPALCERLSRQLRHDLHRGADGRPLV